MLCEKSTRELIHSKYVHFRRVFHFQQYDLGIRLWYSYEK